MWEALPSFFSNIRSHLRRENAADPHQPAFNEKDSSGAARLMLITLAASDQDRKLLMEISPRNRWDVHLTDNCHEAWVALHQLKAPIILCDRDLPGTEWREVVQKLASSAHSACIILLSRVVDDYLRNEVIGNGGYDVLATPLREDEVVRSVRLAWSYWNSTTRVSQISRK